jgi:Zn-dependent protease
VSEPSPQRGWLVGRASGTPVVLSPGWLVAAVVLTVLLLPFARRLAPGSPAVVVWLVAGAAVMLLFASTFLHELAHAAVARRHGMPVHRIALTLLGGHTELGDRAPTAAVSALVAAAGPATNLALGVAAWLVWRVMPGTGPWVALVLALAVTNGFVAVLNLLPGLPLDGGRVLEAGVWQLTGRRSTGTRVAGWSVASSRQRSQSGRSSLPCPAGWTTPSWCGACSSRCSCGPERARPSPRRGWRRRWTG